MARKPLTEAQKNDLIENLQLELTNRTERLKSQYQFVARAISQKIRMRKNRIPKKYWSKTLREVRAIQTEKPANGPNFGAIGGIPKFTIPQDMDLDTRLKSPTRSPGKTLRSPMRPPTSSPIKTRPTTKPAVTRSGSTATQSTASARAKVDKPEPRTRATRSTALKARQAIKNTN
ncbi:hypothetical protein CJU89_6336 [Yarrowia sp. B02]|nr:hypothetical protein CJU89_6336 [Yarrowia sp. B02]